MALRVKNGKISNGFVTRLDTRDSKHLVQRDSHTKSHWEYQVSCTSSNTDQPHVGNRADAQAALARA